METIYSSLQNNVLGISTAKFMKFSLKAFFVLGALIFIYHSVVKQIFSFIHLKYRKIFKKPETVYRDVDPDEPAVKEHINHLQEEFDVKNADFEERITIPREERRRLEKEEETYQFSSHIPFKGRGDKSGQTPCERQDPDNEECDEEETGQNVRNRFPQSVLDREKELKIQQVKDAELRKAAQRPKPLPLPVEPAAGTDGAVTIALRSPYGKVYRRRFNINHTIRDVLNFMTTKGFHYTVYTLSSSYPRRLYNESGEMSLQEADITKDTMLNIEHID